MFGSLLASSPDRQIGRKSLIGSIIVHGLIIVAVGGPGLFIEADDSVQYQRVIQALDAARGAGVSVLGAML